MVLLGISIARRAGLSFVGFGLERAGRVEGVVDNDEVVVASCGERVGVVAIFVVGEVDGVGGVGDVGSASLASMSAVGRLPMPWRMRAAPPTSLTSP